jgi:hypothetical protein
MWGYLSLKTGVHRQGRGEHMSMPVRYAQVGGPKFLVSAREVRVSPAVLPLGLMEVHRSVAADVWQ